MTEARLSGATAPHEMNAAVIPMAGQNTAGSTPRSLLVVGMLDLPDLFREDFPLDDKDRPREAKVPHGALGASAIGVVLEVSDLALSHHTREGRKDKQGG
ncbi:hypothetical protein GCM10007880_32160 [Mesorhizobium amorphae]|nr:hypothetical protein GCM10007880_32160 [Mesorhizobium amorphae]